MTKTRSADLRQFLKDLDINQFGETFHQQEDCLRVLAEMKWNNGYSCRFCGNTRYGKGKTPYARRCTKCKREESATAHTIFHHCRVELPKAFEIAWRVCGTPSITGTALSEILDTRHMTCLRFRNRILKCINEHRDLTAPANKKNG